MLNVGELKEIIQTGENSAVEFKSANARKESLAKEMVAFSNSQGGIILLGVDDDGTISGLSRTKDYEEWVMTIARNNVVPAIQVEFNDYLIDGKKVGQITVPRGKDKPYQTLGAKYLIRVGSTNRTATQPELLRLFQAAGAFHFDATPKNEQIFMPGIWPVNWPESLILLMNGMVMPTQDFMSRRIIVH